jgi:glycyl-tRNA synthetase alpha chain
MTFQGLILKLQEFWASRGCALQQPLDVEVGAGTMHPETFLRVLGPAHWNVAYVQPSRRPADGRFGENPNRLFKHHQFQVILKPAPDEVQQIYLDSLEACGINPRQHDIRFEEDNWESPTLGAWGIGRIAMVLQRADNVFDMEWAPGVKYGDVRHREEVEESKYVFGQVDLGGIDFGAFHRDLFEKYYQLSAALLKQQLIWPALEQCLKCSHLFNILDSSNSIGVTERTAFILRIRQLAVGIARAYVEGGQTAGQGAAAGAAS